MDLIPIERNNISDNIRRSLMDMIGKQYKKGIYKLPTEQQIAEQLGVSRNTLRPVLSQLSGEGIIFRKHGQGTFINPEALSVRVNLQELIDFSGIIERCGHISRHNIYSLEEMAAGEEAAEKLHIAPEEEVLRMECWLYADEIPAIVVEGICSKEIFSTIPGGEVWKQHFGFEVLEQYAGRKVCSDRVRVGTMTVEKMHADLGHQTELKCESVLMLDSIGFDRKGEPVIWGKAYFDTSLIQFDLFRVVHGEKIV